MEAALRSAISRFHERNPVSKGLHEEAVKSLPGGNTRTLLHTDPFPIFMRSGEGHKIFDEDGHEYIDFVGGMTAGLFGHSNAAIVASLSAAARNTGIGMSSSSVHEQRYARLLCGRFGLDRVRFANSGTEANLHCLAAARRFTARRRVIVFRGGYHGGVLSFATGVTPNDVDRDDWVVVQYNDCEGVRAAFQGQDGGEIAAVLMEGIQGSAGFIPASAEFLEAVRKSCDEAGTIFILDEVMTSRLAPGGLKSLLPVQPDMITLGKYLGGGMPFGAFGGRADIMAVYDPRAPNSLVHSGTFQNNVLMLSTGYTALSEQYPPEIVVAFNQKGDALRERLGSACEGTKLCVTGQGSLMCIHFTRNGLKADKIDCKDAVLAVEDAELRRLFWLETLERGLWIHERGSIALSLPMSEDALDKLVTEVEEFCKRHDDLVQPEEK